MAGPTKKELEERVAELENEVEELREKAAAFDGREARVVELTAENLRLRNEAGAAREGQLTAEGKLAEFMKERG